MLLNMLRKGWLTNKYNIKKKLVITSSNHTNNNTEGRAPNFVTVNKYILTNKSIFIEQLLEGKDILSSDTPHTILISFWFEDNNIYSRSPEDIDWWYYDSVNNRNFICALNDFTILF